MEIPARDAALNLADASMESTEGNALDAEAGLIRDASEEPDARAIDDKGGAPDASVETSPLALGSRLVLWLDGARGLEVADGCITRWEDQSGYANTASAPTGLTGKGVAVTCPKPTAPNAQAGVVFDGVASSLIVSDAESLRFGTQDVLIEVVMRHRTGTSCTDACTVFSKQGNDYPYTGAGMFMNAKTYGDFLVQLDYTVTLQDLSETYRDNRTRLLALQRRGKLLAVRTDGAELGVKTMNALLDLELGAASPDLNLGGNARSQTSEQWLDGTIFEIVVVRGEIADNERVALERYLIKKHAL